MNGTIEQLRAAVYGQAIGDALGVPYEFHDRNTFTCTGMIGHGTHNQQAGTWSDDTSMMLATLDSLIGNDWQVDIEDMQHRFNAWLYDGEYAIDGNVFDCGNTVREALHRGHGLHGEWDNGNGSLMRIMPLAFTEADRETVGEVSAITHAHRLSQECCWAWVQLLRSALHGNGLGRLGSYAKGYGRDSVKSGGYVKDTFNAAIWCVSNTSNYRDCVLAAVNLGGDTDTTAAVAGSMAGILYGYEAIPEEWREQLQGKNIIERVLDRLFPGKKQFPKNEDSAEFSRIL